MHNWFNTFTIQKYKNFSVIILNKKKLSLQLTGSLSGKVASHWLSCPFLFLATSSGRLLGITPL